MLQDVNLFVLDQEVGKAKEVKQRDVDGVVKINNYEYTKVKKNSR